MSKKSDLLKELGWNDELIQHYMIEDSESKNENHHPLEVEKFEANHMTIIYNAETAGSRVLLKTN